MTTARTSFRWNRLEIAPVEENLHALDVAQLGAVNLRRVPDDELPAGVRTVALEDQLAERVALREEGKIAGIGISNATLDQVDTAIQVGLAWLLTRDESILLIPGTSSLVHLEENMRVAGLTLSETDLAELDQAAAPRSPGVG